MEKENMDTLSLAVQSVPVRKEKGAGGEIMSVFFTVLVMALLIFGYDLCFVRDTIREVISEGTEAYVVDLNVLADGKIMQILKKRQSDNGVLPNSGDDEYIAEEMNMFREKVQADLIELSGGRPIFGRGSLILAPGEIIDLTQAVAERNGLDLSVSLGRFFSQEKLGEAFSSEPPSNK